MGNHRIQLVAPGNDALQLFRLIQNNTFQALEYDPWQFDQSYLFAFYQCSQDSFVTANAFAEDVQLAKNTGMNGHIAKPPG